MFRFYHRDWDYGISPAERKRNARISQLTSAINKAERTSFKPSSQLQIRALKAELEILLQK